MLQLWYVTRNSRISLRCAIYSTVGILQWPPIPSHILPHETCPDLKEFPRTQTPHALKTTPIKYGPNPVWLRPHQLQGYASIRTSAPQFEGWGYHPIVYLRTSNPMHSARVREITSRQKIVPQRTSPLPTAHARARSTV